jgi:peptide/nickel transport system substrate-binding protein
VIAEELYGAVGEPTAQSLNAPEWVLHPDLDWEFDLDQAAALLDEAGAVDTDGDGVREYEGHPLDMLYLTSINPVRQKQQEITKDDLEEIGFRVELKAVDAAVYFSSDPGNPDTYAHFYADIQMYTHGVSNTYPIDWVAQYASWEIVSSENNWARLNIYRYSSEEMDEVLRQAEVELDPDEQARLFQQINWIVNQDVVSIGTVFRTNVTAISSDLDGYFPGAFRSDVWDIADWTRT